MPEYDSFADLMLIELVSHLSQNEPSLSFRSHNVWSACFSPPYSDRNPYTERFTETGILEVPKRPNGATSLIPLESESIGEMWKGLVPEFSTSENHTSSSWYGYSATSTWNPAKKQSHSYCDWQHRCIEEATRFETSKTCCKLGATERAVAPENTGCWPVFQRAPWPNCTPPRCRFTLKTALKDQHTWETPKTNWSAPVELSLAADQHIVPASTWHG